MVKLSKISSLKGEGVKLGKQRYLLSRGKGSS
jgi:hypothetical protein